MPAKVGIHGRRGVVLVAEMDSRLRGNDSCSSGKLLSELPTQDTSFPAFLSCTHLNLGFDFAVRNGDYRSLITDH
jgi:hypothetical protein